MHLDDRLQALADFVPEGSRAADIGTDHGYLAVALLQQGKADFVVAGDLNRGPMKPRSVPSTKTPSAKNRFPCA